MKHIKCTRKTSYSLAGGKTFDAKAGKVYSVGRNKDVPFTIARQMVDNRTAVAYVKTTKETLIEENKSGYPVDENKADESATDSAENKDEESSDKEDENNKPLDEMNKDELLAYADDKGIKVKKTLGEDRLREAIIAAEENNDE